MRKDCGNIADTVRNMGGPAADATSECTPGPPYVRSANAHVRSVNAELGLRLLCSVCVHLRSDANSKKSFF